MSTLGKILTVMVALVSVVLAALVVRDFALATSWKAAYDLADSNFQEALKERDEAVQQRNLDRTAREAERAQKDEQINTLKNMVAERDGAIKDLTATRENQEKRLAELVIQITGINNDLTKLLAEKDSWRKERDDSMKRADDLAGMYNELENKYRVAQADLSNLKELLRQTQEEKVALESQKNWIVQNYPEVKLPAQVPAVPTQQLKGLIAKTDNEAKVAEINLGADDGVVKGMKFFIYNGAEMKYLATLEITLVSKNSAAGKLSVIRGTVKVNDHVTNKFEQ